MMCCPLVPIPDYYTFDYDNPNKKFNWYPPTFIPIEVSSMITLIVLNPIIIVALIRLQKKSKVKPHTASVSMINGQRTTNTVTNISKAKPKTTQQNNARKQLMAFAQMGLVMLVFLIYMFWYYLFLYFIGMTTKWQTMMNSLFYTFNNMINPFIYFVFKPKMRQELFKILTCRRHN